MIPPALIKSLTYNIPSQDPHRLCSFLTSVDLHSHTRFLALNFTYCPSTAPMSATPTSAPRPSSSAHNTGASVPSGSGQTTRSSRIAPHSHIRGLGLEPATGLVANATGSTGGFVGQDMAREVRIIIFSVTFLSCSIFLLRSAFVSSLGMRCCRWSHQITTFLRSRTDARRGARNRQNRARFSHLARTWEQSTLLPNGWFRGIFRRGEED